MFVNRSLKLIPLFNLVILFFLIIGATTLFSQEATAKPPVNSLLMNLPMILLFFGLIYFTLIAPQKKHQKKQVEFLSSLKKGDQVVSTSGIIGTIVGMNDSVVSLEVATGTEIKMLKTQLNNHFNAQSIEA